MKNTFIERYQEKYDIDEDEVYENRLIVFDNVYIEFDEDLYSEIDCADEESDDELFCSIFMNFTFEDDSGLISYKDGLRQEMLLIQQLGSELGDQPKINACDSMGCPFTEYKIGYFDIPVDFDHIDRILFTMQNIRLDNDITLDVEYLSKNYKDLYESYKECWIDISYSFPYFFLNKAVYAGLVFPDLSIAHGQILINEDRNLIIGFDKKLLSDVLKNLRTDENLPLEKIDTYILGKNYFFGRTDSYEISVNIDLISRINFFLDWLKIDDLSYEKSRTNSVYLVLENFEENFWVIMSGLIKDQESLLIRERSSIKDIYEQIQSLLPEHLVINEYDYSKLTDSQFESMCRDLLNELGFKNIKQQGKTNASDGGVDIIADMPTLFGTTQRWIFQCKHTKAQIGRKDISEVRYLLEEFEAEKYALFFSGTFTPQTISRLNTLKAAYWDKSELDMALRKHKTTSIRYFGI